MSGIYFCFPSLFLAQGSELANGFSWPHFFLKLSSKGSNGRGGDSKDRGAGGPPPPTPAGPRSGSAGQAAIPSLARRGQQTPDCAAGKGCGPAHLALWREGAGGALSPGSAAGLG